MVFATTVNEIVTPFHMISETVPAVVTMKALLAISGTMVESFAVRFCAEL